MESFPSSTAIVTLKKTSKEGVAKVTVGVLVRLGDKPNKPSFQSSLPINLQPRDGCLEMYNPQRSFPIACGLAVVAGIEYVRQQHSEQFDCQITVLEGADLPADCTVGFSIASFMAVARAVGLNTTFPGGDYGWVEA